MTTILNAVVIVVTQDLTKVIYQISKSLEDMGCIDGCFIDNNFNNSDIIPDINGIYSADVDFGVGNQTESDDEFIIRLLNVQQIDADILSVLEIINLYKTD